LKREHVSLSDQVKLTFESFPGLDVLKSVQLLGKALTNIRVNLNIISDTMIMFFTWDVFLVCD
jgi:kinesin family protein C2/C3